MAKKHIVKTEEERKKLEKRNNILAGITITAAYGIFVLGPGFNFVKNKFEEFGNKNKVNRLSMGVQSFNDKFLKYLNRHHNYSEVEEKIKLAKKIGFNNT